MYTRTRGMGLETIFDRYEAQQPQCGFGMAGVCCQLCSHGPCRITGKTSRGICGAAAYTHHLEELADTIKATVRGKTPFTTGDPEKLREIAAAAGLDTAKETGRLAEELAGMMLAELRKSSRDPLALVKLFAPKTRVPKMVLLEVMRT